MNPPARAKPGISAPWLIAFVVLSTAPVLKVGDVQGVELLQGLWLVLAAFRFAYSGMRIPRAGAWRRYGTKYFVFLFLCLGLSVVSLRLVFYTPPDVSVLKQPFFLSLSRIFELFLVAYFMIAVSRALRARPGRLRLALDAYGWIGMLSACVSIAGWILIRVAEVPTFVIYGYDSRARGFFNEGGPFGLFLVSVGVAMVLRAHLFRPACPAFHRLALGMLLIAELLSGSKAGLLAAIALCALGALVSGTRIQKLALAGACAVILAALGVLFQGKLFGYFYAYLNFDEAMAYRPGDPSLIMGRLAAAVILPRMISAHPILGIGAGNYSLMRNAPEYLQGLPPVDDWDLPGMGLFSAAAEFGIPLTLFFIVVLLEPLLAARRRNAATPVLVAAGFQPIAFLLGANLNFFYPWLLAAFVISLEQSVSEVQR